MHETDDGAAPAGSSRRLSEGGPLPDLSLYECPTDDGITEAGSRGTRKTETEMQDRWKIERLMSIQDIRKLFALGRTAAYELTHRPGFPEPIKISPRCYRWWANEVTAFADSMRRGNATTTRIPRPRQAGDQRTLPEATPPLRITGTTRFARPRKVTVSSGPVRQSGETAADPTGTVPADPGFK